MFKVVVTKHAIEEYLNDNPKEKDPETKLKYLFSYMLSKSKKGEAKYHIYEDRAASIIRYKNQAIVYDNYTIITYYRIIHPKIEKYRNKILSLLGIILNGEREKQVDLQIQKHKIQKKLKENRKILRQANKAERYNILSKCFNTR